MNEVLSDDEPFNYTSESYNESSASSESDSTIAMKQRKPSRIGNIEITDPDTS